MPEQSLPREHVGCWLSSSISGGRGRCQCQEEERDEAATQSAARFGEHRSNPLTGWWLARVGGRNSCSNASLQYLIRRSWEFFAKNVSEFQKSSGTYPCPTEVEFLKTRGVGFGQDRDAGWCYPYLVPRSAGYSAVANRRASVPVGSQQHARYRSQNATNCPCGLRNERGLFPDLNSNL